MTKTKGIPREYVSLENTLCSLESWLSLTPLAPLQNSISKAQSVQRGVSSNCLWRPNLPTSKQGVLYNVWHRLSFWYPNRLDYKCLVYFILYYEWRRGCWTISRSVSWEGFVVVYGLWSWHTSPTFFNANRINVLDHANNQLEVVIAKFYYVCSFSNSVVCQNQ